MGELNWLAILIAASSAFVLGGLWYSPLLFGKKWLSLIGLTAEQQANTNAVKIYGLAFILSLLAALVFSMFLGPDPDFPFSLGAGFSAGLIWVAGSFGINYLFEQKPFSLLVINGGYHTVQYTLYGVVFGLM